MYILVLCVAVICLGIAVRILYDLRDGDIKRINDLESQLVILKKRLLQS